MAQTGFTPIQLYSSSTPTNAPSAGNLTNDTKGSELAINIADKNLFFKDSTGVVNTVPIRQSGASSNGWLSSTDWNTFNNKQPAGTYVTSVGATAPVASSGGTTPTISMPAATTSVSGYLTNTDWNTFNNKQAALVSGSNIKTVNGTTLLGPGDLGTIGVGYGGTGLTSVTAGRVLFGNSSSALNTDGGFFWDNSGKRLGVNTGSPSTYDANLAVVGNIATVNTGSKHYLYYISATNHAAISSSAGGDLTFITGLSSPTTRQTIFASGGVSIGNTIDPGAGNLRVNGSLTLNSTASTSSLNASNIFFGIGTAFAGGQSEIYTTSTNPIGIGTAGSAALTLYTASTGRLSINTSGIVTMSAYGAGTATFSAAGVISSVSDETWKVKDGVPLNPNDMIKALTPGYWYYNSEKADIFGKERQLGFYAQNVNKAIGEEAAPSPQEGKPWGYYDRSVLAVVVLALQNVLATVEDLENQIKVLQGK